MNLHDAVPEDDIIISISERVRKRFPSAKGQCEFMAKALTEELRKRGIRCHHVMGNFHLDEPGAFEYISPEDEDNNDEYVVNHDWVKVNGKILDISATQFKKYIHEKIPDIVYAGYADPISNHYEELGHVEST